MPPPSAASAWAMATPPVDVRTAAVAADGHGSVLLHGVSVQWRLDAAVPPALSGLDLRAEVG